MNWTIILAHPRTGSFNHAIADYACEQLNSKNYTVFFHDLYREAFPPVLSYDETIRDAELPELVTLHCDEIRSADGIIIVHPNWWGQPPAILKGWIDRVFRPGVAYKFIEGDNGEGVPVGLLKAKIAVVFNTSNTNDERERTVFGDPLETIWKNCIFNLCGVNNFVRKTFSTIVNSNEQQRSMWLSESKEILENAIRFTELQSKSGTHIEKNGLDL